MQPVGSRFDVAVFPLPNAVLFPGVSLPLHIFEARYEQMLKDIEARGWPLAISLAVPHSSTEFVLNAICGAGRIERFRDYPDGRADILVHGQQRVKLCGFVQREPYFVMEAETLEPLPVQEGELAERELREFKSLVKAWTFLNPKVPDDLGSVFEDFASIGGLCDFFVFHFLKKAMDKQVYLNSANPLERAEMLTRFLETDLARQARKVSKMSRHLAMH